VMARTEAEHGHAEAGVGEDRDGFEDDRRHLEVPPASPAGYSLVGDGIEEHCIDW
jgi:hypothetical protein